MTGPPVVEVTMSVRMPFMIERTCNTGRNRRSRRSLSNKENKGATTVDKNPTTSIKHSE